MKQMLNVDGANRCSIGAYVLSDYKDSSQPEPIIVGSGGFCLALGLVVIAGWHVHSPMLIQLMPTSAPMYYNTAVGFSLLGLGMLGVAYRSWPVSILVATVILILGIAALSQYLLDIGVGSDQFLQVDTTQMSPYPGRMAPTTALCFVISGVALLLTEPQSLAFLSRHSTQASSRPSFGSRRFFSQTTILLELVSIVVTTWGVVTCILYVGGMMGPQVLGSVSNMAFHTAVGFTVFGLGLWAVVWRRNKGVLIADSLAAVITGVFTIALVMQLALSSVAARSIANVQTSIEHENGSESIVYLLEQLFSQLKDAETGQRGYLLTGEHAYLEPYIEAVAMIHTTLRDLEILGTKSRALGQEHLATLKALTEQKLTQLQETITLRQRQGLAAAVPVVRSGRGKGIMDRLRVLIRTTIDTERTALAHESQAVNASMQETRASLIYGAGFSLFLIPGAGLVISWQLWKRRGTEAELRTLNANLDKQVEERTAELAEANVELQRENLARVQAQESLAHYVRELARSNSELEHFAHVASHDLQEPLRKILAFGDRLKVKCGPDLNDQGRDYLERMQSAAARMQALIDDLLTFSRVTTQSRPFAPVDLSEVAHTIVSDMEISIQRVNGHVQIDSLPTIDGDAVQLGQVL
ncbi:MAG: CHASE3 domain-containing protein, partial [Candidatus Binatia bacterium]